jgi:hypothetical protein
MILLHPSLFFYHAWSAASAASAQRKWLKFCRKVPYINSYWSKFFPYTSFRYTPYPQRLSGTCIETDRKMSEHQGADSIHLAEGGVLWLAVVNWALDVRFELIPTLAATGLFVPIITLRVYSSTLITEAPSSAERSVHFVCFLDKMRDYKLLKDSSV